MLYGGLHGQKFSMSCKRIGWRKCDKKQSDTSAVEVAVQDCLQAVRKWLISPELRCWVSLRIRHERRDNHRKLADWFWLPLGLHGHWFLRVDDSDQLAWWPEFD
jgi:hypothetical protein